MPSTTFTVRVEPEVKKRLEKLAKSTGRTRSFSPPRRSTNTSKSTNGRSPASSGPLPRSTAAKASGTKRSRTGSIPGAASASGRRLNARRREYHLVARGDRRPDLAPRLHRRGDPLGRGGSCCAYCMTSNGYCRTTRIWAVQPACPARANSSFHKRPTSFLTACNTEPSRSCASITAPDVGPTACRLVARMERSAIRDDPPSWSIVSRITLRSTGLRLLRRSGLRLLMWRFSSGTTSRGMLVRGDILFFGFIGLAAALIISILIARSNSQRANREQANRMRRSKAKSAKRTMSYRNYVKLPPRPCGR